MSLKLTALALGITLFAISIPVSIILSAPPTTEVAGIADSDGDGVADDEDFYDLGNGAVRVAVESFRGECGNWFGPCKPRFEIRVDVDYDGDYDLSRKSDALSGNRLDRPFAAVFDIPERATKIRLELRIVDTDGGDPVDWTTSPQGRWGYLEVPLPTVPRQWDERGTIVAWASVSISLDVVGI